MSADKQEKEAGAGETKLGKRKCEDLCCCEGESGSYKFGSGCAAEFKAVVAAPNLKGLHSCT